MVFPAELVESLLCHDGCSSTWPFFEVPGGYRPMSAAEIVEGWRITREALTGVDPDGDLVGSYWHPQWVPFATTISASEMVLGCRPGDTHGAVGEMVKGDGTHFGRRPALGDVLDEVADALEGGLPIGNRLPVAFGGRLD